MSGGRNPTESAGTRGGGGRSLRTWSAGREVPFRARTLPIVRVLPRDEENEVTPAPATSSDTHRCALRCWAVGAKASRSCPRAKTIDNLRPKSKFPRPAKIGSNPFWRSGGPHSSRRQAACRAGVASHFRRELPEPSLGIAGAREMALPAPSPRTETPRTARSGRGGTTRGPSRRTATAPSA